MADGEIVRPRARCFDAAAPPRRTYQNRSLTRTARKVFARQEEGAHSEGEVSCSAELSETGVWHKAKLMPSGLHPIPTTSPTMTAPGYIVRDPPSLAV